MSVDAPSKRKCALCKKLHLLSYFPLSRSGAKVLACCIGCQPAIKASNAAARKKKKATQDMLGINSPPRKRRRGQGRHLNQFMCSFPDLMARIRVAHASKGPIQLDCLVDLSALNIDTSIECRAKADQLRDIIKTILPWKFAG